MNGLECSIAISLLTAILFGVNQGFSQTNDTEFTTYENGELGISFQYPGNWSDMDEEFRKQIAEVARQSLSGQNLTTNEKIYADAVPVAFFINPDVNNPLAVTLVNYEFPNSISIDEFNKIGLKFLDALGYKATIIENANTIISNNEANKDVIKVDEGPAKGESTSITFFKGNEVTSIQLGATNNADQASIIKKIVDSIKINN
jgi:hypothetical protein